jgi:hypothetical protein
MLEAELLGHGHGERQAARLEGAGRQAPLVLDDGLAALEAEAVGKPCERDERGHDLAQADHVFAPPHGQELTVAPEAAGARGEDLLVDRPAECVQVVADQERLAGVGEAVDPVGLVALSGHGAFEMSYKGWMIFGHLHRTLSH